MKLILIYNIYDLFSKCFNNEQLSINIYAENISYIIKDYYHKHKSITNINIWSSNNLSQGYDIHYFYENKWVLDTECKNITNSVINNVLIQIKNISKMIMDILNAIINYDINYIAHIIKWINYNRNNECILYICKWAKLDLIKIINTKISQFNSSQTIIKKMSELNKIDYTYDNIINHMKQQHPISSSSITLYNNCSRIYLDLFNFATNNISNNLILKYIKKTLYYDNKNDERIDVLLT